MLCISWIVSILFSWTVADSFFDNLKAKIKEEENKSTLAYITTRIEEKGFRDWDIYGRWRFFPWDEYRHYPGQTQSFKVPPPLPKYVKGKLHKIPPEDATPDYRMPEPPYRAKYSSYMYWEEDRYYRISPAYLQLKSRWNRYNPRDNPMLLSCYCVTVFKRLTPLGMCAILTLRHVLTTASSTDLILRRYRHKSNLVDILGFWYETDTWRQPYENASYYASPARIHYHPKWIHPSNSNGSHPFPAYYDLSVWASTYQLINPGRYGSQIPHLIRSHHSTQVCHRCSGPTTYPFDAPTLKPNDMTILVGVQMVRDIDRYPYPWFKYALRTTSGKRNPCPKVEWGWFHCIEMQGQSGKLGHDSGGPLHVAYRNRLYNHRYSGLAGINSFSMRLRSKYFVNYYTVLERHIVLDFLYAAYMGRLPYAYLDDRFENTQWKGAVYPKWQYRIWGLRDQYYYSNKLPENVFYNSYLRPWRIIAPYEPIWW